MLRYSINFEDFKQKAHALNIQVDEHHKSKDYGQVINYPLTDLPQQRPARDYTLNKKSRKYSFDKLVERFENNHIKGGYHVDQIKQALQNLDDHILKQNEQLKYENPTEENKFKIKALQLERKDLQAQYQKVVKKMKTYDAGQEIIQEKLKEKTRDIPL